MEKIKKGDIVARKSHGFDILFTVEKIFKNKKGVKMCILRGITVRIIADAYLDDIVQIGVEEADNCLRSLDTQIDNRVNSFLKKYNKIIKHNGRNSENRKSGLILHLDGDKLYSEKTSRYYKKVGLNAVVKNIPENKQPLVVKDYIQKYSPDVLILTRT